MGKKKKAGKHDELIQAADGVCTLWLEFRKLFRKGFSSQEISPDEEHRFLEIKSDISRLQRIMTHRLPDGFRYGGSRMTTMMSQAVTIESVRDLPMTDKRGLYQQWHESWISLQHLRGMLDLLHEGVQVQFEAEAKRTGNLREQMDSDLKGKKKKKNTVLVVAVVVLAAAVWYFMTR